MQIEPMPTDDDYRCWLSAREQEALIDHYDEEPQRQLAIELMLDGLRSEEVPRVAVDDVRQLDAEPEAYKLRIWESKTDYRACPISRETRKRMVMLKNVRGIRQGEPLLDVSDRTIQRWVEYAREDLAAQDDEPDDWRHVSSHDLRRTWATSTYYNLDSHYAVEVVMRWGGWSDRDTFVENYLGREPDHLAAEMMEEAGLR